MPFNNGHCPKRENLRAVEELDKVLDKDKHSEGGDEKNKTGSVISS